MPLATEIRRKRKNKNILLMTHIVLGYPSFAVNRQVIAAMVANGVDLIEMQIPFSEPVADGPVIVRANQESLTAGTKVKDCLEFAAEMAASHDIPFLFMTYYNIVFRYGEEPFLRRVQEIGLKGLIVPDLPPEESGRYLPLMAQYGLAPIQIFAPTSTEARMTALEACSHGFIYCVARRGVTGSKTTFDQEFDRYLSRCRQATALPLAVGFGIRQKADVDCLLGKADIAVIGSETIRLVDEHGPEAVGPFIASLRR